MTPRPDRSFVPRLRLLVDAFYGRLFELELFASSVAASNGVVWLMAALATPGVMMSGNQMFQYAHIRTFAPAVQDRYFASSQTFHIHFAMAVAGLVTMLLWLSLTPDRRDALVLGPLPVRTREQAWARLLALSRFFLLVALAVGAPTAVVYTFLTVGASNVAEVPARIAGHLAGVLFGTAFVSFLLVDLQLLLAAAAGPRAVRLATLPLQVLALTGMVLALSRTDAMVAALLASDGAGNPWVAWNPAAWFVGVYRWCAGAEAPVFAMLAGRAVIATGVVVGTAVVAYPLAYPRCLRGAIDGERPARSASQGRGLRVWLALLRPWLRSPLERGLALFVGSTLMRSSAHRFLVGSYIGIGVLCALPLAARLAGDATTIEVQYAWFSIPLGLTCWLAAGVRVGMMLPVEPGANWLFQLTEPLDKRRIHAAVVTVLAGASAVPLALAFGLAAALAGGPVLGVSVMTTVAVAGLALAEAMTLTLRSVPGTCTYRPGQLRLRALWPLYLTVWLLVAYQVPTFAVAAQQAPGLAARLQPAGALAVVWLALRAWRGLRAARLRALEFEPPDPDVATTIDLMATRV